MKKVVFLFFLMISVGQMMAQTGNGVNVFEDPRIKFYIKKYSGAYQVQATQEIHRIKLVGTYNRDEANRAQSKFRSLYPGQSSYLEHNGTQFVVKACSFPTRAEAEVFLQELKRNFPGSFILPPEKQQ